MENFDSMALPESLMHTLKHIQFTKPTPIQAQAIPHALAGKDVLGSAQTGTGKTAAFGIPLITWLDSSNDGISLILTPTRELAVQVRATLHQLLGKSGNIKTALLIGGESMGKQLAQLHAKPRIIIGTPGRINDHLDRKSLKIHNVGFFVLDEFDRMLDIGLGIQVDAIVKFLPKERQTLMFSATLPENIVGLSQKYLQNPVRVAVGEANQPIGKIKQETIQVEESEKYGKLISELDQRQGSIIVFVKTKYGAEKLAVKLRKENHSADAIHGDLRQNKRDSVIRAFRDQKYRIMVATDIAARGLDIPHIEHVINYDMPQCPEDYIHRIGRTARAGAEGSAMNLISPLDSTKWRAIHRMLNPGEKMPHMAAGKKASSDKGRGPRGPNRSNNGNRSNAGFGNRDGRRNNGNSDSRRSDRPSFGESASVGSVGRGDDRRRSDTRTDTRSDTRFGAPARSSRGSDSRFGNGAEAGNGGYNGDRRRSGPSDGNAAGGFSGERRRSGPGASNAGGFSGERRRSAPAGGADRFGDSASRGGPSRGGRPGGAPRSNTGRNAGPRQGFSGPRRTSGSGKVA
jgi:ATP-dependent RNA helicase DeaD